MPAPRARSVSQQRNRPRARGKPPDKTKLGRKVKATVEGAPKVSQACTKRVRTQRNMRHAACSFFFATKVTLELDMNENGFFGTTVIYMFYS